MYAQSKVIFSKTLHLQSQKSFSSLKN